MKNAIFLIFFNPYFDFLIRKFSYFCKKENEIFLVEMVSKL